MAKKVETKAFSRMAVAKLKGGKTMAPLDKIRNAVRKISGMK